MIIVAIIFLVFSIVVGILDVKNRKLEGFEKIMVFLFYVYFGISMGLFVMFMVINAKVSILIFLHLMVIVTIISLKYKKHIFIMLDLLIMSIIGILLCIYDTSSLEYSKLLYIILGIGIYVLPILSYYDRRDIIVSKIKRCTEEVDAKIIKVYKARRAYIPKFEFELNNKKYKFMDSTEIYFRKKEQCEIGNIIKLFVSPNPKIDGSNGCEDVFLPNPYKEYVYQFRIMAFYISTLLIFLLIIFLKFIN